MIPRGRGEKTFLRILNSRGIRIKFFHILILNTFSYLPLEQTNKKKHVAEKLLLLLLLLFIK